MKTKTCKLFIKFDEEERFIFSEECDIEESDKVLKERVALAACKILKLIP